MIPSRRRFALILWCLAGLVLAAMVVLSRVQLPATAFGAVLAIALLLFVFPVVIGMGLAGVYQQAWLSWQAWAVTIVVIVLAGIGSQGPLPVGPFDLQGAATLMFVGAGAALYTGTGIVLFQRDIALAVGTWASLGVVWGYVLWWRVGGDFIAAMLDSLLAPSTSPKPIFWPSVLIMSLLCLTPLALASFAWHTWRLVARERARVALPVAGLSVEEEISR